MILLFLLLYNYSTHSSYRMRNIHILNHWQPSGQCWVNAAHHAGSCQHILRDKRQLALAFTNCHLAESKRPLAPEPHLMSDATFAIYTEFFTHAADLCFHIQGETLQQHALHTLQQLHQHANDYLQLVHYAKACAGVAVVLVLANLAKRLQIPFATAFAHTLIVAHVAVCTIGFQLALPLAALAGYATPTIKRLT